MPILGYPAHPEHDPVTEAAVVFGVSDPPAGPVVVDDQERADVLRIVDSQAAGDFESFVELASAPIVMCADEVAELLANVEVRVMAQRADWHIDLSDAARTLLAARGRSVVTP